MTVERKKKTPAPRGGIIDLREPLEQAKQAIEATRRLLERRYPAPAPPIRHDIREALGRLGASAGLRPEDDPAAGRAAFDDIMRRGERR